MKTSTLPPHGPNLITPRAHVPRINASAAAAAHAVLEAPPAPPQTPRGLSMSVPEETEPPAAHAPPLPAGLLPGHRAPREARAQVALCAAVLSVLHLSSFQVRP